MIPSNAFAIIIGAMKCGTTSLYSYLEGHPELCPAATKEPEFFSQNQNHRLDIATYEELWNFDAAKHRYAMEASTGYTKYPMEPNVPKAMHQYGIRPKFIYLVRDPFERICSHFNYMKAYDNWDLQVADRHLIDTSNYYLQLLRFLDYFPVESFLVLDFEELCERPSLLLGRVYNFLDISRDHIPETFNVHNPTSHESDLERRLRRSRVGNAARILPPTLKSMTTSVIRRFSKPKVRRLNARERDLIHRALRDDMKHLSHKFKVNVGKWGFDS